jgi:putative sigma-54 modulation protein
MRVDVSFRNLAASEPLRDYASDKITKLRRFLVKPMDAHVVLTRDGFRNIAEAHVRAKGESFKGRESSDEDMYAAIDLMADKLAVQARRYKDRIRGHRASPTGGVVGALEEAASKTRSADLDAELDALEE